MKTFMRKRKDGNGYSLCSCPDELVGKGRCCHILEEGVVTLEVKNTSKGCYNVKMDNKDSFSINAEKETLSKFLKTFPKIQEEKRKKLIDFLEK